MRENVERVGAVDIDRNIDGSGECVYTVYCHSVESCGWRPARDGYGTHDIAEARVLAEAHMTMRHAPQTVLDHVIRLAELEYGAAARTWQGARGGLQQCIGRGYSVADAYDSLLLAERRMNAARLRLRVLDSRRGQLARRREREAIAA